MPYKLTTQTESSKPFVEGERNGYAYARELRDAGYTYWEAADRVYHLPADRHSSWMAAHLAATDELAGELWGMGIGSGLERAYDEEDSSEILQATS